MEKGICLCFFCSRKEGRGTCFGWWGEEKRSFSANFCRGPISAKGGGMASPRKRVISLAFLEGWGISEGRGNFQHVPPRISKRNGT